MDASPGWARHGACEKPSEKRKKNKNNKNRLQLVDMGVQKVEGGGAVMKKGGAESRRKGGAIIRKRGAESKVEGGEESRSGGVKRKARRLVALRPSPALGATLHAVAGTHLAPRVGA